LLVVLLKRFRPEQYRERIVAKSPARSTWPNAWRPPPNAWESFRRQENA